MPTYSTLGRASESAGTPIKPEVTVLVDLPDLATFIKRMEKRDSEGGTPPIVHVAPAQVSVYPEIKIERPELLATFNVPTPVVNVNVPEVQPVPVQITVDMQVPKGPFVILSSGVYFLLFAVIYLILAMHFPDVIG